MSTYTVTAVREGRWWVVDCGEYGVTQAKNLAEAREAAADLIAVMIEDDVDPEDVVIIPSIGKPFDEEVAAAREAVDRAARLQIEAAQQSRAAVEVLVGELGLSGRDAAAVLGVSPQRVSQLVANPRMARG